MTTHYVRFNNGALGGFTYEAPRGTTLPAIRWQDHWYEAVEMEPHEDGSRTIYYERMYAGEETA